MRRALNVVLVVLVVVFAGAQAVRPARTNPPSNPAADIAAVLRLPPAAAAVLDRSCRDCHSSGTRWPWYSHIAPASWLVTDHVDHGRSHLNFSAWGTYDRARQTRLLEGSCELAREERQQR